MPTLNPSLPSDGTDAIVEPYNAAIQAIVAVLNGNVDADNIADGAITLTKLATAVANALVPVGTILPFGGSSSPNSAYLFCDGSAVSRSTYAALFAVTGTAFGAGNGTTTFNLPDLRGRVPVGTDNMNGSATNRIQRSTTISTTSGSPTATPASMTGLAVGMVITSTNVPAGTTISTIGATTITMSANATATASGTAARFSLIGDAQSVGATGGTDAHVLITAQLAAHSHTGSGGSSLMGNGTGTSANVTVGGGSYVLNTTTANTGSDQAHTNMQPSQVVNYLIKA